MNYYDRKLIPRGNEIGWLTIFVGLDLAYCLIRLAVEIVR